MGFLEAGTPLQWEDSLEWMEYIRKHGIQQFIHTYNRIKDRQNDALKWGDEIEYHLVQFDPEGGPARIALIAPETLLKLEAEDKATNFPIKSAWRPEYGSWMIEATPGVPYGGTTCDLHNVERNMAMRRFRISAAVPPCVSPLSIVNFPLLGAGPFTTPVCPPGGPFSESAYLSDACISPHPRFGTLTANIRRRRGRKVEIQVPRLGGGDAVAGISDPRFVKTEFSLPTSSCVDTTEAVSYLKSVSEGKSGADHCNLPGIGPKHVPKTGNIHMDAMAFGMGCCCLQVTFQARDISESRFLYDQLANIAPLVLALTANSPIWRGHLAATDTRWEVISNSVDCRCPAEGRAKLGGICESCFSDSVKSDCHETAPNWLSHPHSSNSVGSAGRKLEKSRYSSIDCYISDDSRLLPEYNDTPLPYDESDFESLRAAGVDASLAKHVANLFVRDPLVIFKDRVNLDDTVTTEHFENLQSTNWRSMRWKPPPADAPSIGWRVELRTMEAQVSDFENAAFTVFVVLISRVILFFDLNLYIPVSLMEENMKTANKMDAATKEKFWFRKSMLSSILDDMTDCGCFLVSEEVESVDRDSDKDSRSGSPPMSAPASRESSVSSEQMSPNSPETPSPKVESKEWRQMSISEILLGSTVFPGLIPLIHLYLQFIQCDQATVDLVERYLELVVGRSTGATLTGARWQRNFVERHPLYKGDGVVCPTLATELLEQIRLISVGATVDTSLQSDGALFSRSRGLSITQMTQKADLKHLEGKEEAPAMEDQEKSSLRKELQLKKDRKWGWGCPSDIATMSPLTPAPEVPLFVTPSDMSSNQGAINGGSAARNSLRHPFFGSPLAQEHHEEAAYPLIDVNRSSDSVTTTSTSISPSIDSRSQSDGSHGGSEIQVAQNIKEPFVDGQLHPQLPRPGTQPNESLSHSLKPHAVDLVNDAETPGTGSVRMRGRSFGGPEPLNLMCSELTKLVSKYRTKYGLHPTPLMVSTKLQTPGLSSLPPPSELLLESLKI